jgi:hypothetical protein
MREKPDTITKSKNYKYSASLIKTNPQLVLKRLQSEFNKSITINNDNIIVNDIETLKEVMNDMNHFVIVMNSTLSPIPM